MLALVKGNPATLDEAVTLAMQLESVEGAQKAIHKNFPTHTLAVRPNSPSQGIEISALCKEVKSLSAELQKLRIKEESHEFS